LAASAEAASPTSGWQRLCTPLVVIALIILLNLSTVVEDEQREIWFY
jgi:hypothetical protein